jgi:hypothetical protein
MKHAMMDFINLQRKDEMRLMSSNGLKKEKDLGDTLISWKKCFIYTPGCHNKDMES